MAERARAIMEWPTPQDVHLLTQRVREIQPHFYATEAQKVERMLAAYDKLNIPRDATDEELDNVIATRKMQDRLQLESNQRSTEFLEYQLECVALRLEYARTPADTRNYRDQIDGVGARKLELDVKVKSDLKFMKQGAQEMKTVKAYQDWRSASK